VDPLILYNPVREVESYLDGQHNGGVFSPKNLSVYGYTYQNPLIYTDPNGKQVLVVNGQDVNQPFSSFAKNSRTAAFALRHPIAASRIGSFKSGSTNISSVASRIARHAAEDGNMTTGIGTERNALRHGIWSAMIRTEFEGGISKRATNVHEGIAILAKNKIDFTRDFSSKNAELADSVADYLNNQIGTGIAENNPDATPLEIAGLVLTEFRDNGMHTSNRDENGNYSISKSRISQAQHENAMRTLETLDANGFSAQDLQDMNQ